MAKASAFQAEGCGFESYRRLQGGVIYQSGEVPEWLKGMDCKSIGAAYGGSNPSPLHH